MFLANSSKGRGEQVVRSIFPETTIVRPAPMFGFEDNLLLKLAGVMNLFTANNMQERFWPVHVSYGRYAGYCHEANLGSGHRRRAGVGGHALR